MIIPFALRIAARRALDGATFAGSKVEDSAIAALEDLVQSAPQPFIVISTDEQTIDLAGLDVTAGRRQCDLVIDIAVASAVQANDGSISIVIPHTDAGLELSVNMIARQALRALFEPSSGGKWGKIFRTIAGKATRILVRRGAGVKGVRFAAAQLIISLETLSEPAFGLPPDGIWLDLFNAMRDEPALAPQADMIASMIVGANLPDWRVAASLLGIADDAAGGIGILPLGLEGGDEEISPIAAFTLDPDGFVADADAIAEQLPEAPA